MDFVYIGYGYRIGYGYIIKQCYDTYIIQQAFEFWSNTGRLNANSLLSCIFLYCLVSCTHFSRVVPFESYNMSHRALGIKIGLCIYTYRKCDLFYAHLCPSSFIHWWKIFLRYLLISDNTKCYKCSVRNFNKSNKCNKFL